MAPILSILYHLKENNINRKVTLYFGARHIEDLFLIDQIKEFEKNIPDFKFVPCLSKSTEGDKWKGEKGRVIDALEKYLDNGDNKEAYLRGSPVMIDSVVSILKQKGLSEDSIYYDKFE